MPRTLKKAVGRQKSPWAVKKGDIKLTMKCSVAKKAVGHQKRPCCRMNVSWSDWKVRQGRAYSVTLPPACGRRQGYRIMPCPFGLSSHSRRPSQSQFCLPKIHQEIFISYDSRSPFSLHVLNSRTKPTAHRA